MLAKIVQSSGYSSIDDLLWPECALPQHLIESLAVVQTELN